MKRETVIWTVLFLAGGAGLLYRGAIREQGMGKVYVTPVRVNSIDPADTRNKFLEAAPNEAGAVVSVPRTLGLWISAFFTLCIFSFLYRDNMFYKLAESVMVGVTAGYAMVAGFWDGIVVNLLTELTPGMVRGWALPGTPADKSWNPLFLVPLCLGIMLLWRLAPRGGWISRWPLAFIIGTTAGIRLIGYLDADFVIQIRSTIVPLVVLPAAGFDVRSAWLSIRNVLLVSGVLACLTYFFFSIAHRGVVGRISRVGIWILMITFGASFAFTVMGRIAVLASRLQFLFDDWLWLIDSTGRRAGM